MARKITTLDSEDDKLIKLFKEKTKCDDCDTPVCISPVNRTTIKPPEDTLAVIVDVRVNDGEGGALFIHEQQGAEFVDMVGMEHQGQLVIVPWDGDWCYYTILSLRRVGYIRKKEGRKK